MHQITETAVGDVRRASALLYSFLPLDLDNRLFDSSGSELHLTDEGRWQAEAIRDRLAPLADAARRSWGELPGNLRADSELADSAQLVLQLIVLGVSGALAGPIPDGEAMASVARLADEQSRALDVRSRDLS